MDPLIRSLSAWDGLQLCVRDWRPADGGQDTVLLGLPGLVRSGADFAGLAARYPQRRVVSLDYIGRGGSARSADAERYGPEPCLRDVMDVCAALHLHRVVAVGTSFGGLLAMGLAAARPGLLAGVVLNDIGPEVGSAGAASLHGFIADDPALPGIAACAAHLRARLPDLSLQTDAEWQHFAALTYAPGQDGRWHPQWDTRIADLLKPPTRDLWPLFGALAGIKLLLIQGGRSALLLGETVARMQAARPDMALCVLPDVGHAPTLAEPAAAAAIDRFLETV
jgi:pimeloyl-ACP methyl ester carboxylesterase